MFLSKPVPLGSFASIRLNRVELSVLQLKTFLTQISFILPLTPDPPHAGPARRMFLEVNKVEGL
jgi:hypothetical protein